MKRHHQRFWLSGLILAEPIAIATMPEMSEPPSNPFSTRYTRPVANEFAFSMDATLNLDTVLQRLEGFCGWGEIVGPHGSGKSTLVHSMMRRLQSRNLVVAYVQVQLPNNRSAASVECQAMLPGGQLIIDGFEQLGWWRRRQIVRHCRRCDVRLLVTSHRSMGLPEIWRTQTSLELAQQLVQRLLGETRQALVTEQDVARAFQRQSGNMREVFMDLYDQCELRREVGSG